MGCLAFITLDLYAHCPGYYVLRGYGRTLPKYCALYRSRVGREASAVHANEYDTMMVPDCHGTLLFTPTRKPLSEVNNMVLNRAGWSRLSARNFSNAPWQYIVVCTARSYLLSLRSWVCQLAHMISSRLSCLSTTCPSQPILPLASSALGAKSIKLNLVQCTEMLAHFND
jgi:hypothetical protein